MEELSQLAPTLALVMDRIRLWTLVGVKLLCWLLVGCQDYATSPSASRALVRSTIRVHRTPPSVRDNRETPLLWDGMASNIEVIWVFGKIES
jgi:hypothetical protein